MTQLDPNPQRTRPQRRSWRDLPASPPLGEPASFVETERLPIDDAPEPGLDTTTAESPRRRRSRGRAIGSAAIVLALLAGGVWYSQLRGNPSTTTPTVPGSEAGAGSPAAVAAALGPAVVHIEVLGGLDSGGGVGSGVIYDVSGLVLTAHHVVSFSDEVEVRTADDRTFTGRVVGRAPERDLAVIALEDADDLVAATIAEPGTVEVGEPAIALGSPFGFSQSVTAGIISGLDRELETPAGTLTGLIQTDAPINPGNSGGPLADAEAKVIGINTAIASMSGGNDGVGFAIPVEDFASLIEDVEASGGVDAETIPAPDGPALDALIPGLEDLLPGLEDLLPGLNDPQSLQDLPGLEEMLDQLFGLGELPPELSELLDDLYGLSEPVPGEGGEA